jgi:hypothetical protein
VYGVKNSRKHAPGVGRKMIVRRLSADKYRDAGGLLLPHADAVTSCGPGFDTPAESAFYGLQDVRRLPYTSMEGPGPRRRSVVSAKEGFGKTV